MSFKISICKDKNGGEPECTNVNIRHGLIITILVLVAIAATINFFVGLPLGQPMEFVALSLILSLIAITCAVPILGLVIIIGYFVPWIDSVVLGLGIMPSFWLDAVVAVTWWIGLIAQIVVLVWLVYMLVAIFMGKRKSLF